MTTFERIKQLAKKRGYTLSALNDKAGLGTNSIYHWRNKTPSTQSLNKVAKVLGVSADYLLGETEKKKTADLNKNDFHFHSLRHAHVAYLLSQGVDLTIISKRLGHADTTVTSKVYAYLVEEYKDKAENQIEKYLENI